MESSTIENQQLQQDFVLQWADNSLVLGQRLAEWCGHGPILEQDIAISNIALDLIGEARSLYQYAAELGEAGQTEDDLAFLRDVRAYKNVLLVEQPNGDFGQTVLRLFFYEAFHVPWLERLLNSADPRLAAVAEKAVKEARYHLQWSSEWVIRLGDGTEESNRRMNDALSTLWPYCGELMMPSKADRAMAESGAGPDLETIEGAWQRTINEVLLEATLEHPGWDVWMHEGGKEGMHSEHLGYMLAEMQFLQRTYPGNKW